MDRIESKVAKLTAHQEERARTLEAEHQKHMQTLEEAIRQHARAVEEEQEQGAREVEALKQKLFNACAEKDEAVEAVMVAGCEEREEEED